MYDVLIGIDNAEDSRAIAQAEAIVDLPTVDGAVTAHLCHVFQENPEGASVHQISAVRRAPARPSKKPASTASTTRQAATPQTNCSRPRDDIDADAICVSGRKRRPTGKAVFGSVTQDVILVPIVRSSRSRRREATEPLRPRADAAEPEHVARRLADRVDVFGRTVDAERPAAALGAAQARHQLRGVLQSLGNTVDDDGRAGFFLTRDGRARPRRPRRDRARPSRRSRVRPRAPSAWPASTVPAGTSANPTHTARL